jgi:hypothetical protein
MPVLYIFECEAAQVQQLAAQREQLANSCVAGYLPPPPRSQLSRVKGKAP